MTQTQQLADSTLEEAVSWLSLSEVSPHSQLEDLIQDEFRPHLESHQRITRLEADDPYFQPARELWKRNGWDGEGLSNFIGLLCGILNFPAILLLNPSEWDNLPWNDMIRESPTLSWLQRTLEPLGLTLRDIIIIDVFPLLTNTRMDAMGAQEKQRVTNEVFNLTINFLRHFKPPVIISCQCATRGSHGRWGIVDNPLALSLCSSVDGARRQEVASMSVDEHRIRVVQAFHPMKILYEENLGARSEYDQVLRSILETVYRPCSAWRNRHRQECEENLHSAAEEIRSTMRAFLDSITKYHRVQRRAITFGIGTAQMRSPVVSNWEGLRADVRSFVANMLPEV
ncbi:uncharacterized protein KD926_003477 [Aspergillus affinis]|uniref:uncharacterized protein n=1 Tax=Aspergillus affinis TaxID=1070780 RepID=UPI0022FEE6E9|nr:uncharacterized protein KD926_003477 [Aspergillus affinis]KAI9035451.1 hypothetical protein KD926_003477 [Aspergillus affinis]